MLGLVGRGVAVLCIAAASLSACGAGDESVAEKSGTGTERHDVTPLTHRFDELADASGATWYSGTLGEDRVAGPSSYWIDAVVQLPPKVVETLVTEHAPTPTSRQPDVVADLVDELPGGPLLTSGGLREAIGGDSGWTLDVWLAPESDELVLVARGQ